MKITVRGAGVVGLWQALLLARAGHRVRLVERTEKPFEAASSWRAGAMLAPHCEAEVAEPIIERLGLRSIALWKEVHPGVVSRGSLVLARPRDRSELARFARVTRGHERVDGARIDDLEPDLEGRFSAGLFYPDEAHMQPHEALHGLLQAVREAGAEVAFGTEEAGTGHDWLIDCRGLAARDALPRLRGVRGEMVVVRCEEIALSRPIRLLHPRFPLYVVPWGYGYYMIGATVIESEDEGRVRVRSALELLAAAYALHPAFGEAEIFDLAVGLRPAFPDNVPRIVRRGRCLHVNGLYRHGFLMAPALGEIVTEHLATGTVHDEVFEMDDAHGQ